MEDNMETNKRPRQWGDEYCTTPFRVQELGELRFDQNVTRRSERHISELDPIWDHDEFDADDLIASSKPSETESDDANASHISAPEEAIAMRRKVPVHIKGISKLPNELMYNIFSRLTLTDRLLVDVHCILTREILTLATRTAMLVCKSWRQLCSAQFMRARWVINFISQDACQRIDAGLLSERLSSGKNAVTVQNVTPRTLEINLISHRPVTELSINCDFGYFPSFIPNQRWLTFANLKTVVLWLGRSLLGTNSMYMGPSASLEELELQIETEGGRPKFYTERMPQQLPSLRRLKIGSFPRHTEFVNDVKQTWWQRFPRLEEVTLEAFQFRNGFPDLSQCDKLHRMVLARIDFDIHDIGNRLPQSLKHLDMSDSKNRGELNFPSLPNLKSLSFFHSHAWVGVRSLIEYVRGLTFLDIGTVFAAEPIDMAYLVTEWAESGALAHCRELSIRNLGLEGDDNSLRAIDSMPQLERVDVTNWKILLDGTRGSAARSGPNIREIYLGDPFDMEVQRPFNDIQSWFGSHDATSKEMSMHEARMEFVRHNHPDIWSEVCKVQDREGVGAYELITRYWTELHH
ncbi:hypothetical protein KEM56_007390 [Ascosphaera pollenicola]|nr:hypothetical protein KEM56_007390 [Ascosphaera pollenicola]